MGNKLFVGNLSWNTSEDTLRALFQEKGTVNEVHIVTDRETGRSRGFAFVTMGNDQEAQEAMSLDQTEVDGRQIRVNEAQERRSGGGGGGGAGGRGRGGYRGRSDHGGGW